MKLNRRDDSRRTDIVCRIQVRDDTRLCKLLEVAIPQCRQVADSIADNPVHSEMMIFCPLRNKRPERPDFRPGASVYPCICQHFLGPDEIAPAFQVAHDVRRVVPQCSKEEVAPVPAVVQLVKKQTLPMLESWIVLAHVHAMSTDCPARGTTAHNKRDG